MTDFLCPKCGKTLISAGKSLVCENGHTYDVAKSGYVNLMLVNRKNSVNPGDNKEMIAARKIVMAKGYYDPLATEINAILESIAPQNVLDAGCGTGYLAKKIKERFNDAFVAGTDISKSAVEAAAKGDKNVRFAVASSKNLPFEDGKFDAVVCAFAPVYAEEFSRVTRKGGLLLRVVPAIDHLYDLKRFLYEEPRKNEEDETSFEGYRLHEVRTVDGVFCGNRDEIKALVKMTPYYYHTSEDKLKKLEEITDFSTKTSFELRIFIVK